MKLVSIVMMGYMLVIEWKDQKGFESYLFVEKLVNFLSLDWMCKLMNCRSMFLVVIFVFQFKGWDF